MRAERAGTPAPASAAAGGKAVYSRSACLACHTVKGFARRDRPNLTHVGSRTSIAAGMFPNDSAHLAVDRRRGGLEAGSLMPPDAAAAHRRRHRAMWPTSELK